jgi:hypothetical protein
MFGPQGCLQVDLIETRFIVGTIQEAIGNTFWDTQMVKRRTKTHKDTDNFVTVAHERANNKFD